MASVLAFLLVMPADALRFELIRALRQQPQALPRVLAWRWLAMLPISLVVAALVQAWTAANPAGPAMVVFTGVMAATWLWMRFWMRSFIADPDHPLLRLQASTLLLTSYLSAGLWLAAFTQASLLVAWIGASKGLYGLVLVWPLADSLLLVWGQRSARAGHWLTQESAQRRWGKVLGTALLAVAIWAMWAVLAQE